MTLEQIKLKIGERCDDPSGTAYADRYEGLFVSAMCDVIKAVDKDGNTLFSSAEYPELAEAIVKDISFVDGFAKLKFGVAEADITGVIFVLDVYSDPVDVNIKNRTYFQRRTFKKLLFIRENPIKRPAKGEGYWGRKGNSVYVLIYEGQKNKPISFDVAKNPSSSDWGTQDLETVLGYGRSFIEACIKRAGNILRSEIGLE